MIVKKTKRLIQDFPTHTVIASIISAICIGTALLALPICRTRHMDLIDLFFTATSLTTVTGLLSVPLQDFTVYGQAVLLFLMQIGGLGLMTMSLFIISLFVDLGLYTQILASEVLSLQSFKDTKRLLIFIIKLTFICEFIGAVITFFIIQDDFSFSRAIFVAVFHSVSSYCNTGLSLFAQGALSYNTNLAMLFITTVLILFGSLGFVIWHDLYKYLRLKNHYHKKLSWHTNLVLKTFFGTMAVTCVLFWLLERNGTLSNMSWLATFFNIILVGVSTKSAGYLTVGMNLLQPATVFLIAMTAFIGSAPSSTGSGIKTNAFAIFLSVIRATLYGRSHAELHGRSIARDQVYKAMSIISLASCWIVIVTFCLLITEHTYGFMDVFFEAISAFANNGLSTGITSWLSVPGKILITLTMIIGRIGALTLVIGMRKSSDTANFSYPEERVILG